MKTNENDSDCTNIVFFISLLIISIFASFAVGYKLAKDNAKIELDIIYRENQNDIKNIEYSNNKRSQLEITQLQKEAVQKGYAEWVMEYPEVFKFKWK